MTPEQLNEARAVVRSEIARVNEQRSTCPVAFLCAIEGHCYMVGQIDCGGYQPTILQEHANG